MIGSGSVPVGAAAPLKRPSELKSSSIASQWMPYPPPLSFHCCLCSSVAFISLGYQTRETVIVRPSIRDKLKVSSESFTSAILLSRTTFLSFTYVFSIFIKILWCKVCSICPDDRTNLLAKHYFRKVILIS